MEGLFHAVLSKDLLGYIYGNKWPSLLMKLRVNKEMRRRINTLPLWQTYVKFLFPTAIYKKHLERGDTWFEIYVILCQVHSLIKIFTMSMKMRTPIIGNKQFDLLVSAEIIWPKYPTSKYESYGEWFDEFAYYYVPLGLYQTQPKYVRARIRELRDILVKKYNMKTELDVFENGKDFNGITKREKIWNGISLDLTRLKWKKQEVTNGFPLCKWMTPITEKQTYKVSFFVKKTIYREYVWVPAN